MVESACKENDGIRSRVSTWELHLLSTKREFEDILSVLKRKTFHHTWRSKNTRWTIAFSSLQVMENPKSSEEKNCLC